MGKAGADYSEQDQRIQEQERGRSDDYAVYAADNTGIVEKDKTDGDGNGRRNNMVVRMPGMPRSD